MKRITSRSRAERVERIEQLRAAALHLVERHGKTEQTDLGPVRTARRKRFYVIHTTPFFRRPGGTDDVKYQRALQVTRGMPKLLEHVYGADVWVDGKKVLNLEWDRSGTVEVISFKRGPWEDELLLLAEPEGVRG